MKRALGIIFLIFLACSSFSDELTDEEKKLKQIQEQLEKSKQVLLETKKKESETLSKLVVTKGELKQANRDLSRAKQKIQLNEGQIKELNLELSDAEQEMVDKSKLLQKRVREVYKNSSVNYLEMLLSAKSMSDFINRAYYFGRIVETDVALIQEITDLYRQTKKQKSSLEWNTREIKGLASQISRKRVEIAQKAEEEKDLYQDLKSRRAEYERKIAELEASSERLERVIQAKLSQKRTGTYLKGSGAMDWPLRGRLTSRFGYRRHPLWGGRHRHTGIDIAAPHGDPIRAADSGVVIFSGWWDGYGKALVIDHGKKISTVYGHMSRIYVQNDSNVRKGQIIGLVGSTGYSTGPHLHFEVRINGKPTNPMPYLP